MMQNVNSFNTSKTKDFGSFIDENVNNLEILHEDLLDSEIVDKEWVIRYKQRVIQK